MKHYVLPVSPATVHWGYFSKAVTPSLTLRSGDRATIETLTHHANDDHERMIAGVQRVCLPGGDFRRRFCVNGSTWKLWGMGRSRTSLPSSGREIS
jgi:hypothetical protein